MAVCQTLRGEKQTVNSVFHDVTKYISIKKRIRIRLDLGNGQTESEIVCKRNENGSATPVCESFVMFIFSHFILFLVCMVVIVIL